jgi:DNA-directed RNA polymerase subunit RPC12/RpoP
MYIKYTPSAAQTQHSENSADFLNTSGSKTTFCVVCMKRLEPQRGEAVCCPHCENLLSNSADAATETTLGTPDVVLPSTPCDLTLSEWLEPFFPDANEPISLRFIGGKLYPTKLPTIKYSTTRHLLATDSATQSKLLKQNLSHGIYFLPNSGGDCDVDITRYNAVFAEIDDKNGLSISEQHKAFDTAPLPSSIRLETRHSVHCYWLLISDCACNEADWRAIQQRLIHFFKSDSSVSNPSRPMRLPFFNHLEYGLTPKRVVPVQFNPERGYTVLELMSAFPAVPAKAQHFSITRTQANLEVPESEAWGGRYEKLKVFIANHGIKFKNGSYSMKCPLHNGNSPTSLFFIPSTGAIKCWTCGSRRLDEICNVLGLPIKTLHKDFLYLSKPSAVAA